jgi:hypothetical protein
LYRPVKVAPLHDVWFAPLTSAGRVEPERELAHALLVED